MDQRNELTPEEEACSDRVMARSTVVDPVTVGILKRAAELAERNESATVTVKEALEALLHTTITPTLIHHLQAARSIMEDERGEAEYLDDTAVLAAQLSDGSSVWQILDRHVDDMDALIREVRAHVRDSPADT